MNKCGKCGKEFSTTQALGGHRAYCSKLVRVGSEGSEGSEGRKLRLLSEGSEGIVRVIPSLPSLSPVLRQAEDIAKRYVSTGKRYNQVQWGKLLASLAIGGFVAWLIYKALDSWDWKGSPKKQISPYKLIGGLIQGLG